MSKTRNDDDIGRFVENLVKRKWEAVKQPFFLSNLVPAFTAEDFSYRDYLGNERLKNVIIRLSEGHDFKVIEHPTQKAKIGLVPKEVEFKFDGCLEGAVGASDEDSGLGEETTTAAHDFLDALSRLSPELLDGISIPAKTLARLLKKS